MKQLETRNQKLLINILSFYRELGIETTVLNKEISQNKTIEINKINNKSEEDDYNIENKNKEKNIKELEFSFKNFEGCNLKKTSTNFVSFFGDIKSQLLIIDGPPDVEEDKKGFSFVSNKGLLLEKMLNSIELNKDEVFVVKGIPWRPPGNRYPSVEEIKMCRPFILNLIKLLKPKIIVCLGEIPTNQILELNDNIINLRGKWRILKSDNLKCEYYVLPTFSISHLLLRPDLKRHAWEDMKSLRDKIKEIL